jgi:hypothetical protein
MSLMTFSHSYIAYTSTKTNPKPNAYQTNSTTLRPTLKASNLDYE